jgi:hypothetical protein
MCQVLTLQQLPIDRREPASNPWETEVGKTLNEVVAQAPSFCLDPRSDEDPPGNILMYIFSCQHDSVAAMLLVSVRVLKIYV